MYIHLYHSRDFFTLLLISFVPSHLSESTSLGQSPLNISLSYPHEITLESFYHSSIKESRRCPRVQNAKSVHAAFVDGGFSPMQEWKIARWPVVILPARGSGTGESVNSGTEPIEITSGPWFRNRSRERAKWRPWQRLGEKKLSESIAVLILFGSP